MNVRRFRVAFSFAGEKRDYVAQVAAILAKQFGEAVILYDKYHESEFAVYDLGIRLPELYGEQSDLIVPVLCLKYDHKRWTGWEWLHIYGLLTKADGHRVMPSRFEHAHIDGLSPAAGYIELDDKKPEEFAILILERLATNEGKPKDHYTRTQPASPRPAHTDIPNNLPRLQPFFGREAELAKVAEALDPDNRAWGALIDGSGGMGKTSLAVRAAYDYKSGQFNRIVFISVKDRELDDDGVRELGAFLIPGFLEMLNELARELGHPGIAKSPEDQRVRLLLDALRDTRALLILDNLESLPKADRDKLFTFVKRLPQGCKAILTSRRRIGSGSEELILEQLDQGAALATLADLARRNPLVDRMTEAERVALYQQTGGKPLLLRWVAGQLGRGSCRIVADALTFLGTCPPENDPLEFIFGDLVDNFSEPETKVLCALTYFSLPAKVEHIAEIAELEKGSAETALSSLANRSLVVPDQEEKAFALVPMVAVFLRRRKPEVVAATGDRLEKCAYELIIENGGKMYDQFRVLNNAWATVAAALPRLIDGQPDRLQELCKTIRAFLEFTGRWDELFALSRAAETKAIGAQDLLNAGWRAYHCGMVHQMRGQSAEVLGCAERATIHWREAQAGVRELATGLQLWGHGHSLAKNYAAAIVAYREAVIQIQSLGRESNDVVIALNWLAKAEALAGDYTNAERDFRRALRIARSLGFGEGVATLTGNLADLALDGGDWPRAESLAREALPLAEAIGRQQLIASNHRRIAKALARQDRKDEALPHVRRAVEIFTALRSVDLEAARQTLAECEE